MAPSNTALKIITVCECQNNQSTKADSHLYSLAQGLSHLKMQRSIYSWPNLVFPADSFSPSLHLLWIKMIQTKRCKQSI